MSNISYITGSVMTLQEKRAWIRLVVAVVGYSVYAVIVVNRADGRALAHAAYAGVLLWTIGSAIAANIVAEIAAGSGITSVSHSWSSARSRRCSWPSPGGIGSGSPT